MRAGAAARLALCVALLLAASAPAWACVPAPGWPEKVSLSTKTTAELLARAATHIDLVEVERFSPDYEYATRSSKLWSADPVEAAALIAEARESWSEAGVRIHYRVLETLKGPPQDRFTLNGVKYIPILVPKGVRPPRVRDDWPLTAFINRYDLADAPSPAPCEDPLFGEVGGKYLVLRDAAGHPLNHQVPMRFEGKVIYRSVASVVPVSGANSAWVGVVRRAVKGTSAK